MIPNEQLVKDIQAGIQPRDKMETLFLQNRGITVKFIYSTLKVSYIPEDELEDFIQGSYFAMHKAVHDYDHTKEASFITYYRYHLMNQLLRKDTPISINFKKIPEESLDRPIGTNPDQNNLCLAETIQDESSAADFERFEDIDYSIRFWECVRKVLPDQMMYDIMTLRFKENLKRSDVVEALGTNYNTMRLHESRAYRRLRAHRYFKPYVNDYWENIAYRNVSSSRFNTTFTSSTEKAALQKLRSDQYALSDKVSALLTRFENIDSETDELISRIRSNLHSN